MLEWLQPLPGGPPAGLLSSSAAGGGVLRGEADELPPWLFWAYIGISAGLILLAGLMSGLNLALMSLDEVDLEVLKRSGTDAERRQAKRIAPVIANEHFLLVTLLLFNALATEALPIFLDRLVDPVTAVVLSVSVVLVFGEVLPQAACRSYGLAVGSYSAWLVRALMLLGAPISWPIGKLLDWALGGDHGALFRRAQLKALVGLHSSAEGLGGNLTADEISIITGALDLTSKTAWAAMTPLDKVFMLPADRPLDEAALQEVLMSGHSRVPLHEPGDRRKLLGLILVKELVLIDPEQGLTAGQLASRPLPLLPADTPLYQLLRLFEAGGSHMVALAMPPPPGSGGDGGAFTASTAAAAAAASGGSGGDDDGGGGAAGGGGRLSPQASGSAAPPTTPPSAASLPRIKSGVIRVSNDTMLYIEAQPPPPPTWQQLGSPPPSADRRRGGGGGSGGASAAAPAGVSPAGSMVGAAAAREMWEAAAALGGSAGSVLASVRPGDPVGVITIEDVIEELLQQEIIDETDQFVDNLQVTRVDASALTSSLPPRLRKAYAQQFTPRVGRLVVHHPQHHQGPHHGHGQQHGHQQQRRGHSHLRGGGALGGGEGDGGDNGDGGDDGGAARGVFVSARSFTHDESSGGGGSWRRHLHGLALPPQSNLATPLIGSPERSAVGASTRVTDAAGGGATGGRAATDAASSAAVAAAGASEEEGTPPRPTRLSWDSPPAAGAAAGAAAAAPAGTVVIRKYAHDAAPGEGASSTAVVRQVRFSAAAAAPAQPPASAHGVLPGSAAAAAAGGAGRGRRSRSSGAGGSQSSEGGSVGAPPARDAFGSFVSQAGGGGLSGRASSASDGGGGDGDALRRPLLLGDGGSEGGDGGEVGSS